MCHSFVTSDGFIHCKTYVSCNKQKKGSWDILPSRISVSGSVLLFNEASDLHFGSQTGYFKGDFSPLIFLVSSRHVTGYYFKNGHDFLHIIYRYRLQVILQLPIPLIWHKRLSWLNSPLCAKPTYPYNIIYGVQILKLHNYFFHTSQFYPSLRVPLVWIVQLKFLGDTKPTNYLYIAESSLRSSPPPPPKKRFSCIVCNSKFSYHIRKCPTFSTILSHMNPFHSTTCQFF